MSVQDSDHDHDHDHDHGVSASTPLDLLINAIAGSSGYHYPPAPNPQDARDSNPPTQEQTLNVRSKEAIEDTLTSRRSHIPRQGVSPSPRQKELAKTLTTHVIRSSSSTSGASASTIEVWHPTTAQKSYGKERRILNPPPILRVSGPLLPNIASATLSSVPHPALADDVPPSGSQTHKFGLTSEEMPDDTPEDNTKRAKRRIIRRKLQAAALVSGFGASLSRSRKQTYEKDRERLQNGLIFPALWVGEEAGKRKEFMLELKIAQISNDEALKPEGPLQPVINTSEAIPPTAHDFTPAQEDSDLAKVLGTSSIDVLQPLAEAVQQANADNGSILADFAMPTTDSSNVVPQVPDADSMPTEQPDSKTWATFLSSPLKIVSKPSQKTAKARSMASCFARDASFSLWTRIHAQTVRTKYMKLEPDFEGGPQLTSKTGKWTPFRFEIIQRANPIIKKAGQAPIPLDSALDLAYGDNTLIYGSIVAIVDLQTGIKSESVKLVKVENNQVRAGEDEGQPVSELQRIGLVRANNVNEKDDLRWYLSAPGARLGGGEIGNGQLGRKRVPKKAAPKPSLAVQSTEPETLNSVEAATAIVSEVIEAEAVTSTEVDDHQSPAANKRRKTKRNALAVAALAEDADGGTQSILHWVRAETTEITINAASKQDDAPRIVTAEKVEDWMSWIIGGVSSFSYSVFDTSDTSDESSATPIDPIPRVLIPPVFHSNNNILDLTLSQFHFPSPDRSHSEPLEVYLGPMGPLHITTWRSTSSDRRGTFTAARPYPLEQNIDAESSMEVMSGYPAELEHVIVVVQMPDPEEIIRSMQDCVAQAALEKMLNVPKDSDPAPAPTSQDEGDQNSQKAEESLSAPWFDSVMPSANQGDRSDELAIAAALDFNHPDFAITTLPLPLDPGPGPSINNIASVTESSLSLSDPTMLRQSSESALLHSQAEAEKTTSILLTIPPKRDEDGKQALLPFPLMLVRKDGMVFGTGRKVIAQKQNHERENEQGNGVQAPEWALKVVEG